MRRISKIAFVVWLAGLPISLLAQPTVTVNMAGLSISEFQTAPPDAVRTSSPATISAALGYRYTFNPVVRGTGLFGGALIPSPTPLGDVVDGFGPGMYRVSYGAMRNPSGTRPTRVYFEPVTATVSGSAVSLTLALEVQSSGVAVAAIRNIRKPFLVGLAVDSGGATLETWTPPPAVKSEWHFDGDLRSVKETGLAPDSGPSRLRYLDDPAFGPVLAGTLAAPELPNPPTPTGVTQAQSAFGTTTSFGIPSIGGEEATVYRTSPPRNLADPLNQDWSRGIGLALWPNTRDFWPDDKLSQWTIVMDILIPAASWAAEFPVALFDDNHSNAESADAFIRQDAGQGSIGVRTATANYLNSALIGPNRWMRVAIACDAYRTGESRVFVDGTFIGANPAGWLYNSVKSSDPRFPNIGTLQPVGTAIPAANWNAWGQFPSPWALQPDAANPGDLALATPLGATACLFADRQGRGESVYVASLLFTDEQLTDTQIAALGTANARGIVYLENGCAADFNTDGDLNPDDLGDYINCYFAAPPCGQADFNGDGDVNPDDLGDYINAYFAGC